MATPVGVKERFTERGLDSRTYETQGFEMFREFLAHPAPKNGSGYSSTLALALALFTLTPPALAGQNVWIIEQPGKASEKVDLSPVDDLPDFIPKPKPKPSMPAVKLSAPSDMSDVNPAETPDQTVPKQ